MDNPLDGKLTVCFHDTDAKVGRWRGQQYVPLATAHNMYKPSDAPQMVAALKKRFSDILSLMSEEATIECPECEGQGKTASVTGYVTGDMARDAGEPEMAGMLPETGAPCSMGKGDPGVSDTEDALEADVAIVRALSVAARLRAELAMQEKRYTSLYKGALEAERELAAEHKDVAVLQGAIEKVIDHLGEWGHNPWTIKVLRSALDHTRHAATHDTTEEL